MSNERFMRHHYGPSGYVPPNEQEDEKKQSIGENDRFEIMAELFKASTGFMAPGKSVPPEIASQHNYEDMRRVAWGEWSDTKALNMAILFIGALRHNEEQHDKLYNALVLSESNQVMQERDALRLRIKAVDEEHDKLQADREKMVQAYTTVEGERDFYKKMWAIRGKALEMPCLTCGSTEKAIRLKNGEIP
jgi:hypothetical protein